jgi:hypothetical protein
VSQHSYTTSTFSCINGRAQAVSILRWSTPTQTLGEGMCQAQHGEALDEEGAGTEMKVGKVHDTDKCGCGADLQFYGPPVVAYVCTQTGQLPENCNQPQLEVSDGQEEEN